MEEILRLFINVTKVLEVKGFSGTGRLVLFDGTCEGKYFNGKILDGGVDTQKEGDFSGNPVGESGTLSARYVLSGVDEKQEECSLFIENNGTFGKEFTSPKILTTSENLKWMEKASLKGKISNIDGKLVILIYKDKED